MSATLACGLEFVYIIYLHTVGTLLGSANIGPTVLIFYTYKHEDALELWSDITPSMWSQSG